MRTLLFAFLALTATVAYGQQQLVLLLTEDFEQPSTTFTFGGTGPNQWIINSEFDGLGTYPNTTNQDSIASGSILGTITNAPFSTYLHIHNANAAPAIANANYDATATSDRVASTTQGYCTRGLTDVKLTFFYLCEGSADAYGEVEYSTDGGTIWTKTGAAKYNNQNKWKYVALTDPGFNNVNNLRIRFRWVNDAGSPPSTISFALDEIIMVGTYDPNTGPQISMSRVVPDTLCQLKSLDSIFVQLTGALCEGTYAFELSNSIDSFNNPTTILITNLGSIPAAGNYYFGPPNFSPLSLPSVPPGNCYQIRLNRISPPEIIGSPSPCFRIEKCENTITTLTPAVTTDVDTVCSLSAIDVPFISTGVYLPGNDYIAQLSDSAGEFVHYDTIINDTTLITAEDTIITPIDTMMVIDTTVNPHDTTLIINNDTTIIPADTTVVYDTTINSTNVFEVLGMSENDNATYDPDIGAMPGTVSGLIPRVKESCNYYIRVVSNNPDVIGSLYGPFCIKQCDVKTNKTIDIHVCIHETVGVDTTIVIDIHEWDSTALYLAGNQFIVQVLDMMSLAILNEGDFGIKIDVDSSTMTLSIPGRNFLPPSVPPGSYYMRIIADNSTHPWNSNGTIIRLTIGAPNDSASVLISDKDYYCDTETGTMEIVPFNPDSEYEWYSVEFFGSEPDVSKARVRGFSYIDAPPLPYGFLVREINFGCYGPVSPRKTVYVITQPDVNISGPRQVCAGDTFIYRVTFISQTYYDWSVSWGRIIDTSNNEIVVTFDSAGTTVLNIYAINDCGVKTGSDTIEVISILDVDAGDNQVICKEETTTLRAESEGLSRELTTSNSGSVNVNGNMFDLRARDDVTISSFDVFLPNGANVSIAIYYRPATYVGAEYDPSSWTILNIRNNILSNGAGIPTPIPIPVNISIPASQTYGFYITTIDGSNLLSTNNTGNNPVFSDAFLEFHKGTANVYAFGSITNNHVWNGVVHYKTFSGVSFIWSDGTTTAENNVSPDSSSFYSVIIKDTAGCGSRDNVFVNVNPLPDVLSIPDDTTFCIEGEVQISASGADTYEWSPSEGLSDANISNPLAMPQQTVSYVVKGKYDETGCINYDTTDIIVLIDLTTVLEINLCDGESYFAGGAEQTVPGTYFDTLIGANGCDSVVITTLIAAIDGCELTLVIPQAFTPNGDPSNNHFTVFGDNIDKYEIRIFNRWGEQVYYSTDASEVSQGDFTKGWDGTHHGKPQDMGVYAYYIKASKGIETPIERKGNVTLIR